MIYDIANLVRGLGGFDGVADAFESLDKLARGYGLGGVHFQYVKINGDFEKIRKEVGNLVEKEPGVRLLIICKPRKTIKVVKCD